MRLTVNMITPARAEEAWYEEFVLTKTRGLNHPATYALTCATGRPPIFWNRYAMAVGHAVPTMHPFTHIIRGIGIVDGNDVAGATGDVDIRRRVDVVPTICSETGEPFMASHYRFTYRFTDPAVVEKIISSVVTTRPFTADVYSTPRTGAAGLLMTASGPGDGNIDLGGGQPT
jgi:hypothetical protein